jgi:hypothetical protein
MLPASAFYGFPAVVTQLIFLAGEAVEDCSTSGAAIDTGAKLPGIIAAGPAVLRTVRILRERDR